VGAVEVYGKLSRSLSSKTTELQIDQKERERNADRIIKSGYGTRRWGVYGRSVKKPTSRLPAWDDGWKFKE